MNRFMYVAVFLCCHVLILVFCSACGRVSEPKKIKDIAYTVCDESRLPKELLEIIEEKKETPFRLSYSTGSYMYIVVGYGEQNRDQLSVAVEDLYLGENAVYMNTTLISDGQDIQQDCITYPYVAVKCEKYDMPIAYLSYASQTY